jgi:tetratricopeptide (TPR) repeat protein
MDKLDTLSKQAWEAMDSGNLDYALQLTKEIQSMTEYYIVSASANRFLVNTGGLLIDIGNASGNQQTIQEGVDLLIENFERIATDDRYAAIAHHNIGNGYSALFDIRRKQEPLAACFMDTKLNLARNHYVKALKYQLEEPFTTSQICVNLGNCFDALGRVLDALECYEKAITLEPNHGMALGNKGVGLYYYATVVGEHKGTFLIEAYSLLSQALKKKVDAHAIPHFEGYLEAIRSYFRGKEDKLESLPKYPGISIKGDSEFEKFSIKFCLNNKLYLNICNYCQRCDAAVGDTAVIKKMIVPLVKHNNEDWAKDDQYLRLSRYLNQIKQDYVTARFMLMLSRYKDLNLDFVYRRVKTIDTLDYSLHNIYVELVKASFKGFYSVLDKVAFFISDYLRLGILDRQVSFRTVWYQSSRDKTIREQILATKNFSLNALFSLHQDFEDGGFKNLRLTRDALTHRFVNVKLFHDTEDIENMSENSLVGLTLELARATRNAILYLLQFVHTEESKKERESTGYIPTLYAQEIPDELK